MKHLEKTTFQSETELALMLQTGVRTNRKIMFAFILLLGAWFSDAQPAKLKRDKPVNLAEKLEFKLSYGWFTVGRASWVTDSKFHKYGGEECYKLKVRAKSSGLLGVFAKVNDEWGEYMRTDDFMPMMTYRDLSEGKYRLDEKTYFDYTKEKIKYDRTKRGKVKPTEYFSMDKARLGMLGGFMQMRSIDFSKYKKNDRIKIPAFFEGETYELEVIFMGVVELKSKVGRLRAYKIIPVMPENKIFPGKYPITAWFTADRNRLPLRVEAKMSFGTTYVELTNYENVRYGPDYR